MKCDARKQEYWKKTCWSVDRAVVKLGGCYKVNNEFSGNTSSIGVRRAHSPWNQTYSNKKICFLSVLYHFLFSQTTRVELFWLSTSTVIWRELRSKMKMQSLLCVYCTHLLPLEECICLREFRPLHQYVYLVYAFFNKWFMLYTEWRSCLSLIDNWNHIHVCCMQCETHFSGMFILGSRWINLSYLA